ncbi:glycosyltransferase family 39 protein [bacterium]|nr:glycosyltransferase family 39 protein [bacterium]
MITNWKQYYRHWQQAAKNWWQEYPVSVIIVGFCLLAGSFLRLYRLPQTLMFMGDQGRDALIVADIFRQRDLVFIGPVTSVGNMYLGPFYYYFMLPWLMISYPSPIGPVYAVALVNIITLGLVYFWGRQLVGEKASLLATVLMTFSALAINYSRFSWNPNLSIFFSLLMLYALWRALSLSPKNWLLVGLAAGLLIQLHYVNLIMVAVAGLAWLWQIFVHYRQKNWFVRTHFWRYSWLACGIFVLTTIPLILFDWRHGWLNLSALGGIFTQESSFADRNIFMSVFTGVRGIFGRIAHIFTTLALPNLEPLLRATTINIYWLRVSIGVAVMIAFGALLIKHTRLACSQPANKNIDRQHWLSWWLLAGTAIISVIALAFYRHSIFDHYLLYFLPILFFMISVLVTQGTRSWQYLAVSVLLVTFGLGNYQPDIWKSQDNNLANQSMLAKMIATDLPAGNTYNLVLLDDSHDYYGSNYRYWLSTLRPQLLPPELNAQAQHLFIIDATGGADLATSDVYEIKTFPAASSSSRLQLSNRPEVVYHWKNLYEQ